MQLNLLAPMHLTRLLAPAMKEHDSGVIINICSVAGIEPMAMGAAYAATKHGLRGWSLSCYNVS
jgi:short-subunit dehydrogenase